MTNFIQPVSDHDRLDALKSSLTVWAISENLRSFSYYPCGKKTKSLYRFGNFILNGRKCTIHSWNYGRGLVTFSWHNGITEVKNVYCLNTDKFLHGDISRVSKISIMFGKIKSGLSRFFGELSEKLRN